MNSLSSRVAARYVHTCSKPSSVEQAFQAGYNKGYRQAEERCAEICDMVIEESKDGMMKKGARECAGRIRGVYGSTEVTVT